MAQLRGQILKFPVSGIRKQQSLFQFFEFNPLKINFYFCEMVWNTLYINECNSNLNYKNLPIYIYFSNILSIQYHSFQNYYLAIDAFRTYYFSSVAIA